MRIARTGVSTLVDCWAAQQHRCDTVGLDPSAWHHSEQSAAVAVPVHAAGAGAAGRPGPSAAAGELHES